LEDDDFWNEIVGVVDRTINGIDRSMSTYNLHAHHGHSEKDHKH